MPIVVKHTKKHASGRVDFRRAHPPGLLPFIPGKAGQKWAEHKVSLGLQGSADFGSRYDAAILEYETIISRARRAEQGAYDPLDAPTLAYLAELFRVRWLERDDRDRWALGETYAARMKEGLEWELDDFRQWAGEGDLEAVTERWGTAAVELLRVAEKMPDPADHDGFGRLCAALNAVAIGLSDTLWARLRGEIVQTPPRPEPPSTPRKASVAATPPAVSMLATFDTYADAQGIKSTTLYEWRRAVQALIAFLGHDDARRVTAADLRSWRDKLSGEMTNRGTPRSPRTVNNKYLTPVRATLAWAVEENMLPENVAAQVKVRIPRKDKLRERSFTDSEALAILSAALLPLPARYTPEHARARRWVPWLCAYTGARVGEIAQLRGQDVQDIEGVWCLRITPEAGGVKNKEARIVPLHPHLIDQGFLDVVTANGSGPLFYDPGRQRVDSDGNRHVKKVGERLAKWVREDVGIVDPGLQPNHGWRHLFKARSHTAGVEERMADALQGHAPATVGRTYGAVPIPARSEAIAKFPRFVVKGV